jgi:PAS domain S-box-containing protein
VGYNSRMASPRQGSEQARQAQDVRLVVDAIPTLAWAARPDGSAEFLNRRWLDYTGLSAEEASDWGWAAALHTEDRDRLMDFWRHLLDSGEAGEIEARLRRYDGEYRWFLFRAEPVRDNHCVDETWYEVAVESALNLRPRPLLMHVGQMVARKGIAEFLRAAARLQQEGLTFSTVLVGEGRDSTKLQRLAAELGLDNIHFYPAQPPKAMPPFYRSADVVIFPTMEDVWGLVANEVSGVSVLCSRYAGCAPELFDPECIFDPADEEQFVAALRRAVRGQLPRADKSRLRSSAEVGDLIANAVLESCAPRRSTKPGVNITVPD